MKRLYVYASLLLCLFTICQQSAAICQDLKNVDLPSISFSGISATLTKSAKQVLAVVADKIKQDPETRVVVTGYCQSSKKTVQLSWDRVNMVITYLVDKEGISAERFIFKYAETNGNCTSVDLRAAKAGEDGPTKVAPPHPNLRQRN